MRRFLPPRSDARCASPSLPQGAKNSRARLSPAGSRLGPGRLQRAAVPLPVRGKGRGLDGHALGIRIAPPHAGNACSDRLFLFLDRITPARAGKRRPSHVYSHPFWEHPCLCTEKICYEAPEDEKNGSPPPMRGKELRRLRDVLELRITPAHAGKRRRTAPLPSGTPDHPACAGKRHFRYRAICRCQDHPRLCGEKITLYLGSWPSLGSPPPVRGKADLRLMLLILRRITPACAGKRSVKANSSATTVDHPRLCGEKRRL